MSTSEACPMRADATQRQARAALEAAGLEDGSTDAAHKAPYSPSSTTTDGDATPEPSSCSDEERDTTDEPCESPAGFTLHALLDSEEEERGSLETCATGGRHLRACVRKTFVDVAEDDLPELLRGCVLPQRPASCPPGSGGFFKEPTEDVAGSLEDSAAGALCASPRYSESPQRQWGHIDAVSELWRSLEPLPAAPSLEDWRNAESWAEWDGFLALYSHEGPMDEGQDAYAALGDAAQDWWSCVAGFVEAPGAGPGPEAGYVAESAEEQEQWWLWAEDAQRPPVPPPPPPPPRPGPRVALSLADALDAPAAAPAAAPDYAPVVPALEQESPAEAPTLAPGATKHAEGSGSDAEPTPAESERGGEEPAEVEGRSVAEAMGLLLGSEELPTVGSAGHWEGRCKPCAFMASCAHGAECAFCHLCGPDERKKRRRDKLFYQRSVRRPGTQRRLR